ncbi:MAG: transcription antitermination factor NusB [Paludibacteraceae bacterium]|nr:transcription antitermination factor NusB [Paludibacteraceae bacterium]
MINRSLLRIKVLQVLYAYLKNPAPSPSAAMKEFRFSLDQTYSLYHYLLLLICDTTAYAAQKLENARHKNLATEEDLHPNTRFVDNAFAAQLAKNKDLLEYIKEHKFSWTESYPEVVRDIYEQITASELYQNYMAQDSSSYNDDKEFWRSCMHEFIPENQELTKMMEDYSIYWNDDLNIVLSFVLKTIRRFEQESGADYQLLPKFRDDEDLDYAEKLYRIAMENAEEYTQLIDGHTKNWDVERISFMDRTIMVMAVTEIINFPTIPVNVTLNEYIELARDYSSEKSPSFINGILDNIVTKLTNENKIMKAKIIK